MNLDDLPRLGIEPHEYFLTRWELPFSLRPFQVAAVNELSPLPKTALYWEPGLGKTAGATVCALYRMDMDWVETTIVLMPPILLKGWNRWLDKVKGKGEVNGGRTLKVLQYRGTPAKRNKLNLKGCDFILMSMQIFKNDFARLVTDLAGVKVHVILDEAQCIKNVASQNYKRFRDFTAEKSVQLLTGTPLNKPEDAYAYIKQLAPSIYRTYHQWCNLHIAEVDFFMKPIRYMNLDILERNLLHNADRKLKAEVLTDLPSCNVIPLEYELDPHHYALYKKIAEEQLLQYEDGTKLDVTNVSALLNALQQVILNYDHFAQDENLVAAGFELIEEVLEEIGGAKLIVFANYRMSNRQLRRRFPGAVGIWGDLSAKEKDANLDRFINDPTCRLAHLQPSAAGVGLDGMQDVCSEVLFIEVPITPTLFDQARSRVWRDGQRNVTNVRMACATGTVQARTLKAVADNQTLVNTIQGGLKDLRASLFGE